jgi:hypothetical protein
MQAIANALEGMTRAEAARLAGMPCLLARVNPDGPYVDRRVCMPELCRELKARWGLSATQV